MKEGQRFKELVYLRWSNQREAAAALGMGQAKLSRDFRREKMTKYFWIVYARKLAAFDLNMEYIWDETQPKEISKSQEYANPS
jgi:hypothetical protein